MAVKLLGMVVLTVVLVFGARSCLGGGGQVGPALNGLFRQGVGGVCADAASETAADDSGSAAPTTLVSGTQGGRISGMTKLAGLGSGALSCPTTTTISVP